MNNHNKLARIFHFEVKVFATSLYQALKSCGGMDDKQAREVANKIYLGWVFGHWDTPTSI